MLSDEEKAVLKTAKENYGLTSAEQKILVNLIEKQSKEIEELKEKYSKKLIEFQKEREWYKKNHISKDKIKAKIEEVEQWELYNMKIPRLSTLDERLGAKIGIKYVLQSLLEKE